jgi:hypothetical protein
MYTPLYSLNSSIISKARSISHFKIGAEETKKLKANENAGF